MPIAGEIRTALLGGAVLISSQFLLQLPLAEVGRLVSRKPSRSAVMLFTPARKLKAVQSQSMGNAPASALPSKSDKKNRAPFVGAEPCEWKAGPSTAHAARAPLRM